MWMKGKRKYVTGPSAGEEETFTMGEQRALMETTV